ncbi:MAG: S41 family peptidase [Thermodesulfobacteriota bacterium]
MGFKKNLIKKLVIIFIICLPFFTLLFWGQNSCVKANSQDVYENLETFSNVLHLLETNYVEDIDTKKVIEGAIKGMLSSLDPHSSYMKPEQYKELKIETKGSFSGIGIEITLKDGILTVVSPIEGTPAYKQGLQAQDKILKINGELTKDLSLMEAVKKLRGPKGSEVTISIHREGLNELKEITIVRDVIPLTSVKSKMIEPGYGYIRIRNFQAKTTKEFKEGLKELEEKTPLKGLLIDVRSNPGGLLDQAIKISDIFLDKGMIVSTKGRLEDQNMEFEAHKNGNKYSFPIVVLVNEGSASASEIIAGALQDHKRAIILGTKTFGKGSVQTVIPMKNGAALRLTTARYYTPDGTSIQATGITPDINVPSITLSPESLQGGGNATMKFLREKDLRHHFSNGENEKDSEKKTDEKETGDETDSEVENRSETDTDNEEKSTEQEKDKDGFDEIMKKDYQLQQALLLLKGINVFSKMQ